jgi:hypothetical protein
VVDGGRGDEQLRRLARRAPLIRHANARFASAGRGRRLEPVPGYQGFATLVVGAEEFDVTVNLVHTETILHTEDPEVHGLGQWSGQVNDHGVPWTAILGQGSFLLRLADGHELRVMVEGVDEPENTEPGGYVSDVC